MSKVTIACLSLQAGVLLLDVVTLHGWWLCLSLAPIGCGMFLLYMEQRRRQMQERTTRTLSALMMLQTNPAAYFQEAEGWQNTPAAGPFRGSY